MNVVLDASIAVKWCAPDGDRTDAAAERVLRTVVARPAAAIVPEIFMYEVLAVLCRRMRQASDARRALDRIARLGLRRIRMDGRLADAALRLAYRYRLSGYDACYAALAREMDATWLTFDAAAHERIATLGISQVPG
jgi:predicted nucleic acid-binding protein